jgi:hypothetical protein
MKKTLTFFAAVLIFIFSAFVILPKNDIVGHWAVRDGDNVKMTIDFNKNGTFKVVIPAEKFTVGGQYKMQGDLISFTDTSCGKNYWGKYKFKFLGSDSVYSTVIEDSCTGRKASADKATLVKVK